MKTKPVLPELLPGDFYIQVSYKWVSEAHIALKRQSLLRPLITELLNSMPAETAEMWKSRFTGIDTRDIQAYYGHQVNGTNESSSAGDSMEEE
jgi:hypothetical protein